jgi:hypothetical protein
VQGIDAHLTRSTSYIMGPVSYQACISLGLYLMGLYLISVYFMGMYYWACISLGVHFLGPIS